MTPDQLRWAATHDWYLELAADLASVWVWDDVDAAPRCFRDFRALREWAGY